MAAGIGGRIYRRLHEADYVTRQAAVEHAPILTASAKD
jgi:hypothetical protein